MSVVVMTVNKLKASTDVSQQRYLDPAVAAQPIKCLCARHYSSGMVFIGGNTTATRSKNTGLLRVKLQCTCWMLVDKIYTQDTVGVTNLMQLKVDCLRR